MVQKETYLPLMIISSGKYYWGKSTKNSTCNMKNSKYKRITSQKTNDYNLFVSKVPFNTEYKLFYIIGLAGWVMSDSEF